MTDTPPAAAPDEGVAPFQNSWQGAAGSRQPADQMWTAECGMRNDHTRPRPYWGMLYWGTLCAPG